MTDHHLDVQLGLDGIEVLNGEQVILEITPKDSHNIVPKLYDARLNAMGWEKHDVTASDIQPGDRIDSLNITVDYSISFLNGEIGVWSDGACVVTFRDPEHKIKVERKIQ